MSDTGLPICFSCTHRGNEAGGTVENCSAFPQGIPDAIILSEVDHHRPYRGDRGIRFQQDPARLERKEFEDER